MAFIFTAATATSWPFYNYLKYARNTPLTPNASGLTTLSLINDDPSNPLFDRKIILTSKAGDPFSTDAFGIISGGMIKSIKITNLAGTVTYSTITVDHALSATTLWNGLLQYYNSGWTNTSGLDSIFRGITYVFNGSAGDDFFEGSNAADVINGNNGDDVLLGFDGDDIINGGAGDDYLDGFGGNNTLNGGAGDDWIIPGTGTNTVNGGGGADVIDGDHLGHDTVTFSTSASAVSVDMRGGTTGIGIGGDAQGDTYIRIERFIGSAFNDKFYASNADSITPIVYEGGSGNDTFFGAYNTDNFLTDGSTAAVFKGGSGLDRYVVTFDDISSASYSIVNLTLGSAERYLVFSGFAADTLMDIENVTGGARGDTITGSAVANVLDGGPGDDTILGEGGADRLIGGAGIDEVNYFFSPLGVRINLSLLTAQNSPGTEAHGDILSGFEILIGSNAGADTLTGTAGSDQLYGVDGWDLLIGGAGADTLDGGFGMDTVSYAASNAPIVVSLLGLGFVYGGHADGDDLFSIESVIGSAYSDTIAGGNSVNSLQGGGGNDILQGHEESDTLSGDAGKDVIDGGPGGDILSGGIDRDRFVFRDNSDTDLIVDFKAGSLGDYLDLREVSNLVFYQQLLAPGVMIQSGANVEIDIGIINGDAGDHITLANVQLANLTAVNFIIN